MGKSLRSKSKRKHRAQKSDKMAPMREKRDALRRVICVKTARKRAHTEGAEAPELADGDYSDEGAVPLARDIHTGQVHEWEHNAHPKKGFVFEHPTTIDRREAEERDMPLEEAPPPSELFKRKPTAVRSTLKMKALVTGLQRKPGKKSKTSELGKVKRDAYRDRRVV